MGLHHVHELQPALMDVTGSKSTFKWRPDQQQAFQQIKVLIVMDALLWFPDVMKPFEVYTDTSNYQLGSIIMKEGKSIAYYSHKLTPMQC